jgi:hypothetical protein
MVLDKKIISEIERYKKINQYILEQADEPTPEEDVLGALSPDAGATPAPAPAEATPPPAPEAGATEPQPIDVESDPDVEKIDDEGKSEEEEEESSSEELDVTELVDSQKNIEKKQDEYFDNLFSQLNNLQSKLGEMDNIMNRSEEHTSELQSPRCYR